MFFLFLFYFIGMYIYTNITYNLFTKHCDPTLYFTEKEQFFLFYVGMIFWPISLLVFIYCYSFSKEFRSIINKNYF